MLTRLVTTAVHVVWAHFAFVRVQCFFFPLSLVVAVTACSLIWPLLHYSAVTAPLLVGRGRAKGWHVRNVPLCVFALFAICVDGEDTVEIGLPGAGTFHVPIGGGRDAEVSRAIEFVKSHRRHVDATHVRQILEHISGSDVGGFEGRFPAHDEVASHVTEGSDAMHAATIAAIARGIPLADIGNIASAALVQVRGTHGPCTYGSACASTDGSCSVEHCGCLTWEAAVPVHAFMSPEEAEVVLKYLKPYHVMLEWGSGGSTLQFAPHVKALYSIEHSPEWCVAVMCALRQSNAPRNVDLRCVAPDNPAYHEDQLSRPYADFQQYVDMVAEHSRHAPGGQFDIVLLDGRSRVPCAIRALAFLHVGSILIFHDFWHRSFIPFYSIILEFYILIESRFSGQTIAVLRPRPNLVGLRWDELVLKTNGLAEKVLSRELQL